MCMLVRYRNYRRSKGRWIEMIGRTEPLGGVNIKARRQLEAFLRERHVVTPELESGRPISHAA